MHTIRHMATCQPGIFLPIITFPFFPPLQLSSICIYPLDPPGKQLKNSVAVPIRVEGTA